jgi:hypothetical protein
VARTELVMALLAWARSTAATCEGCPCFHLDRPCSVAPATVYSTTTGTGSPRSARVRCPRAMASS